MWRVRPRPPPTSVHFVVYAVNHQPRIPRRPPLGEAPTSDNTALGELVASHLALKGAKAALTRRLRKKTADPRQRAGRVIDSSDDEAAPPGPPPARIDVGAVLGCMTPMKAKPGAKSRSRRTSSAMKVGGAAITSPVKSPKSSASATIEYPPIADKPTRWQGGSILHQAHKYRFRAFRRVGDKHEKQCGYGADGGVTEKKQAWELACDAILADDRPRDPAYM